MAWLHVVITASASISSPTDSDIDIKHDHHSQPSSGWGQPHAKCVDLRAGIIEVAIGEAFQAFLGRHSGGRRFGDAPGKGVRDVWHRRGAISDHIIWHVLSVQRRQRQTGHTQDI